MIDKLKPLLEDPGVLKVGQNIKYDMCVFERHGITIGPVDDTMLLSFVLDAGKHGHGMDELAERYLGQKTIKFSDVAGSGAKQVSFDKVPIERAARIRRRGRRRHAAALGAVQAAARRRAHGDACTRPSSGR